MESDKQRGSCLRLLRSQAFARIVPALFRLPSFRVSQSSLSVAALDGQETHYLLLNWKMDAQARLRWLRRTRGSRFRPSLQFFPIFRQGERARLYEPLNFGDSVHKGHGSGSGHFENPLARWHQDGQVIGASANRRTRFLRTSARGLKPILRNPKTIPRPPKTQTCQKMRERYARSERLRLRVPTPQLDIGDVTPGEPVIVQNESDPFYAAGPQEVEPQNDAPQQVQSVAPATPSPLRIAVGSPSPSTRIAESSRISLSSASVRSVESASRSRSLAIASSSAAAFSSSPAASLITSSASASSSVPSSTSASSSSSESTLPASSSSTTSSTSVSASATSAAAAHSYTMSQGAPFYAAIALGALIAIALVATIVACIIRVRARRRAADAATIGWDPVVLEDGKASTSTDPDFSLAGDRDVGEPKRSDSFVSVDRRASLYQPDRAFNAGYPQHPNPFDEPPPPPHPNPFEERAHYASYQQHVPPPPLAESAAYPLPPMAMLPDPYPTDRGSGPYPTARPLPAYLAARDPHRLSIGTSAPSSRASSRSGSVRSHLPSASTLVIANGAGYSSSASSRASTALGMNGQPQPQHQYGGQQPHAFGAPQHAQSVQEFGTPREKEARPRFMSLGDGQGLAVPWQRERTPGWAALPDAHDAGQGQGQGQQPEGWTQTLRASVLGAFAAVTGAPPAPPARADSDDGLTRKPSMGRARREREAGWRRFAAADEGDEGDGESVSDGSDVGGGERGAYYLAPPPTALWLSHAGTGMSSMRSDTETVRTEHSRVPLIGRPRPASRASSVYSTGSAVPGYGPEFGYTSHSRGA
ncbi:hypothetical protein B0H17DRAFT_1130652 [Mycena rosella]|uniref:Uncharacterized protein n=1 Tax=Mycena rosella TaxID=1033263 RepID=A0AAD7DS52_MYCRO|nr:hypothetical protein B0H17DRAFT_1130652 [Mycena rosella]